MSGLPVELDFSDASSLPESRSYEYRIQPSNASTFSTSGSTIQLSLPMLNNTFWENNTMYLTGRTTVTCSGTNGTDFCAFPACGAYAMFSKQTWRTQSGQTLENIDNVGALVNELLAVGFLGAERTPYANTMGLSADEQYLHSSLGLMFNSTLQGRNKIIDWALPLVGIMNMTKYLPAYGTELVLELTLAPSSQWALPITALAGVTAFTHSNIELVSSVLELGSQGMSVIKSKYGDSFNIKTQSYAFGSYTIPASSQGTVDIPFQIKCMSMKQLFMICSPSNVAEGVGYGSVNPNATAISFINNGMSYPQRPIQASRPAESFTQLLKAFGGIYSNQKQSSISIDGYRTASTAYVTDVFTPYNATRLGDSYIGQPNKWFFALDLESISNHKEMIYNGINTQGGSQATLRIEIGTALSAYTHSVYMFSCHDVLINFDLTNGIVSAVY
jgi:hypothetical protein